MANEEITARLWDKLLKAQSIKRTHRTNNLWVGKIGQCIRRSYYELTKTPPDEVDIDANADGINSISQFVMDFGNQFESLIVEKINYASRDGVGYWGKGYVDDQHLDVTGETDPIVEFEGHTIVLECKATHRDHFRMVFKQYKEGVVDKQYYDQIQGYLHLLPETDFGIIVVANRDMRYNEKGRDSEMPAVLLMPVERDNEWRKVNYVRINTLNKSLKDGKAPEREFTYNSFQCKWCPYRKLSWADALTTDLSTDGAEFDSET